MGLGSSLIFFFFVKQKTAYEMRISDWSSDVCSSDLSIGINADFTQFLHRMLRGLGFELARRGNERHKGKMHERRVVAPQAQAHLAGRLQEWQRFDAIGRASCRERVCQYG